MTDTLHIAEIISKKIIGKLTSQEQQELDAWLNEQTENKLIYERVCNPRNQLDKLDIYELFNNEKVKTKLEKELFPTKTVQFSYKKALKYAAAIMLPIVIAVGVYIGFNAPSTTNFAELNKVIEPGTKKAVLVLSNGEEVLLDENNSMTMIADGTKRIRNKGEVLDYFSEESTPDVAEIKYNELTTPKGGKYQLQLADGTKVWLNAGTSIRFPVNFTSNSRDVYLTGEAFFEVTKSNKPFVVHTQEMDIAVLGTVFNVSAYIDNQQSIATLVEGKVRVARTEVNREDVNSKVLAPGDQAIMNLNDHTIEVNEVNTSYYTSWINDKIEFNNEDLEVVMKRLSRWYNFEYEFKNENARKFHFTARLSNHEKISNIIEMLELTADVRFEYKHGKVIIH